MIYYYVAMNMDRYMADDKLPWSVKAHDGSVVAYTTDKAKAQQIVDAFSQVVELQETVNRLEKRSNILW